MISSFWAAAQVRRITGEKKTGHTGTLDPMATGVLPVMLGGATKFCELLPRHDKAYRAKILLGTTTDTLDITGEVLSRREVNVTPEELSGVLLRFTGKQQQLPPMYSAVSKDGVRLYKLARQGIEIEREAREIEIFSIKLNDFDTAAGEFTVDVHCSAGTYIRSLAQDVGETLGCGAVLSSLRRTLANGFSLGESHTIAQLEQAKADGTLGSMILPVESALTDYPALTVTDNQSTRFKNGGALSRDRLSRQIDAGVYRVYSPGGDFLGLGELRENETELSVRRLLVER